MKDRYVYIAVLTYEENEIASLLRKHFHFQPG